VEGGVQILTVLPRSTESRLSLEAGDVIIAVDGKPVTSAEELREALGRFDKDRRIDLRVLRGNVRFHIAFDSR
jgi:S1-C subfamily serine protease